MADDWDDVPVTATAQGSWGQAKDGDAWKTGSTTAASGGDDDLNWGNPSGATSTPSHNRTSSGWSSNKPTPGGSTEGSFSSKSRVSIPCHIEFEKLAVGVQLDDLRNKFGRYGKISRLVVDYRFEEERAFAWLDYVEEKSIEKALKYEDKQKLKGVPLSIKRGDSSGGSSGGFRGGRGGGRGRGGGGGDSGWGASSNADKSDSWDTATNGAASSSDWGSSANGAAASSDWGAGGGGGGRSSFGGRDGDRGRGRGGFRGRGRGGDRPKPYERSGGWGTSDDKKDDPWSTSGSTSKPKAEEKAPAADDGWD
ncbi:hypothetical protein HDE_13147 [Halotydeus destructor]|nr:hypothetical protein HDE_13147 [Halotydeus destructor]